MTNESSFPTEAQRPLPCCKTTTEISNEAREAASSFANKFAVWLPNDRSLTFYEKVEVATELINIATKELHSRIDTLEQAVSDLNSYDAPAEVVALRGQNRELREQLAEALNPIHTCHNECQRPACVLRRERDKLKGDCEAWSNSYHALEKERDLLREQLALYL